MKFLVELKGLDGEAVEYVESIQAAIVGALQVLDLPDAQVEPEAVVVTVHRGHIMPTVAEIAAELKGTPPDPVVPFWPIPSPELEAALAESRHRMQTLPQLRGYQRAVPVPGAPRRGERWTDEEDAQLRTEHAAGVGVDAIAGQHGRTRYGIEQRMVHLGLIEMTSYQRRLRGE